VQILFIDNNRKFVSTSDDKKVCMRLCFTALYRVSWLLSDSLRSSPCPQLFVWEYGIPVVIQHIGEPNSHSIPTLAPHPSGKYFIGQSMDNQILCFDSFNRVKLNRVCPLTLSSMLNVVCFPWLVAEKALCRASQRRLRHRSRVLARRKVRSS
jgi:hypothetical protein